MTGNSPVKTSPRLALLLGFALLILVASAPGCGGPGKATIAGTVTVDGQPLEKGVIEFASLEGEPGSDRANIENGRYEVVTRPGKKRVLITAPRSVKKKEHLGPGAKEIDFPEETLPDRYHGKSELTFEAAAGENQKDWPLKSKPR